MKKYVLKKIGDSEQLGTFVSKVDAADEMESIIENNNEDYDQEDEEYLTPFDFTLEEIEVAEVNEDVKDFETALAMLERKDDDLQIIHNATHPHAKALRSLVKLVTIAEAWNKADGFVPDYSNSDQWKYYPWFKYDHHTAGFVFALTSHTAPNTSASFGSRLCFKSSERAAQFGKQFIDLWNDFLLFR